jgi:glycosyltransferase involved in cell wall biosynthesis
MRILLVSQMYPGPSEPDFGIFVRNMEEQLAARGHEIERAVLDHRGGGKRRYVELARRVRAAPKPDVVYAHFLVPAGLIASRVDAPLVVTAHGQDVANVGTVPGLAWLTRRVVRKAATVVCVSGYLRDELERKLPEAAGKTEVVSMGVDLERFQPPEVEPEGPPRFLCVGSLTERKNVVRLADAFARLPEGTLTFAGDGPLRPALAGRERVELRGVVAPGDVPALVAAHHVLCQPSLIEPLGQALLEGMAAGRSVVATRIGGPPEFVPPDAGLLVDPLDEAAIAEAMRQAAELPCPNDTARAAAERYAVTRQAERVEEVLVRAARGPRA